MAVPKINPEVAQVFDGFPQDVREFLIGVRGYIFEEAALNPEVGKITETLKWREPAYLTDQTKSGTTLRLAWKEKTPDECKMLVNCQTSLVASYKDLYGSIFDFEGTRAIIFKRGQNYPEDAIRHCIALAQTYHLNKDQRD